MNTVSRLAPSPTGLLHVGHARTFLVAWLSARAQGGRIILRHEDLDQERSSQEFAQACERDLAWLGIDWDGPPTKQSDRAELFQSAAGELADSGAAYPCVCTRAEVRAAIAAPHPEDGGAVYPGTCRGAFQTAQDARMQTGREPSLRFTVNSADVKICDVLTGAHTLEPGVDFGDFPITSRDGQAAYHLAVVVDDAHQGVTEVVRADDLLSSCGPQSLLQDALGLQRPLWLHVPLVLDHNEKRLAKRSDSLSLAALREGGLDPRRVVGWLARSLGLGQFENISPAELIPHYEASQLSREPCVLPADFLRVLGA